MREIKFRVWNKADKKWMDGLAIGANNGHVIGCSQGWENFALQQYTGLKDENGVEVFEGDIIGEPRYPGPFRGHIVEWRDDLAMFWARPIFIANQWDDGIVLHECINDKWLNVVGNIYENPELLTEVAA